MQDEIPIADLVKYINRLAQLNKLLEPNNTRINKLLSRLAKALGKHSSKPFSHVEELLQGNSPVTTRTKTYKKELPNNLESLSKLEIHEILLDKSFTNAQLVQLGAVRFGIPHSRLNRLGGSKIRELIESALDHESSLDVISQEAKYSGENRSS